MTKLLPCPTCEKDMPMELKKSTEKIRIKGKEVEYEAEFYRCPVCGTELEQPAQLDRNLAAAREAYERQYASPSPEDLVALRESYGASQKAFSLLLGFGETTMNSYEKGQVPDSTNRLLLKLSQDPVVFQKIYQMNKHKIGLLQRKRIESSHAYQGASQGQVVLSAELPTPTTIDHINPPWVPVVETTEKLGGNLPSASGAA